MNDRYVAGGWITAGVMLGAVSASALLPRGIPTLTDSLSDGTAYWLLARVGGFIAYGLLWISVVFGLLLTGKVATQWPGARQAHALHESVSVLALVYTVFHALILLGDRYIGFDLRMLLTPFSSTGYRPLPVGLGQIAGYMVLVVTVSWFVRHRIGTKAWRVLHYLTFAVFYLAIAHGVLAGSDSTAPWAQALYVSTGAITYALTVYRVLVAARLREPKEVHVRTVEARTDYHPAG